MPADRRLREFKLLGYLFLRHKLRKPHIQAFSLTRRKFVRKDLRQNRLKRVLAYYKGIHIRLQGAEMVIEVFRKIILLHAYSSPV